MAKAMSVQMFDTDDDIQSVASAAISDPPSGAYSCPPVPLRSRRAKMKKSAAPSPPAKLTTPLSQSVSSLHCDSSSGGGGGSQPMFLSSSSSCSPVAAGSQHVSDDCAINELLEGRMDLEVFLPDGRQVLMNVERRTPMMDLLVQVTTPNKISPGGHAIHIITDRGKDFVHYKPSTPIGSLDTNSIYIVPKSSVIDPAVKKMPKVANKPFETTFRLQVNLPRGQLTVYRVSPRTTLADIKQMACRDKNLDHSRYQLVHPQFPNQILDLNSTLSTFGSTEISLMSNSNINQNIRNSTSDIIAYANREDDKKKKGILGLFSRKKSKGSVVDSSSDSMDSRGVSPSRSDSSGNQRAKVTVKKRPAPPPPPIQQVQLQEQAVSLKPPTEDVSESNEVGSTVSHSRHSSDSSGYHEASLLSESPDNLCPDVCSGSASSGLSTDSAVATSSITPTKAIRKTSSLDKPPQPKPKLVIKTSVSDTSLLATKKKKKAPPPPPVSPIKVTEELQMSMPELVIPEEPNSSESDNPILESADFSKESQPPSPLKSRSNPELYAGQTLIKAESVSTIEANTTAPCLSTPPAPLATITIIEGKNLTETSRSKPQTSPSSPIANYFKEKVNHSLDDNDDDDEDCLASADFEDEIEESNGQQLPEQGALDDSDSDLDDNWFAAGCSTPNNTIAPPPAFVNPLLLSRSGSSFNDIDDVLLEEDEDEYIHSLPTSPIRSYRPHLSTNNSSRNSTNKSLPDARVRHPSMTSIGTIADVQNSFDITIAEGEKVLEEERRKSLSESRSDAPDDKELAPLPKDATPELLISDSQMSVSQQQILSHIEAAFNAVEEQADEEETKSQPAAEDDLGWEYPIPDPPPAFRNDDLSFDATPPPSPSLAKIPPSILEDNKSRSCSHSSNSSDGPPPPLPVIPPPQQTITEAEPDDSDTYDNIDSREYSSLDNQYNAPKPRRAPLLNFTIGAYKKQEEDIFASMSKGSTQSLTRPPLLREKIKEEPQSNRSSFSSYETVPEYPEVKSNQTTPEIHRSLESKPSFEIKEGRSKKDKLYGLEGSVRGIKGQVMLRCIEMADNESSPALVGRSASVLCLVPPPRLNENGVSRKAVERSNSTVENLRKSQSVQNLNGGSVDDENQSENNLEEEQERLQDECQKLHQKFLLWKQQLQENQSVLEQQKIVPVTKQPPMIPPKVAEKPFISDDVRCQTLPRQKSRAFEPPTEEKRTFTLERQSKPKPPVLTNVTIGSWQQRKLTENGAMSVSKVPSQSMENIHRASTNGAIEGKPDIILPKPRPTSMYAAPWQKNSNLAQNSTDRVKPKIDVQINNGISVQVVNSNNNVQHSNSLRTSLNKTSFKPPEVRQSSVIRQRVHPEARITENGQTERHGIQNGQVASTAFKKFALGAESVVKNNVNGNNDNSSKTVTYLNRPKESNESKTVQINGKQPVASNGLGLRPSFSIKSAPKVVGFKLPPPAEPVPLAQTNGVSLMVNQPKTIPIQVPSKNGPPMPPPLPAELTAGLAGLKSVSNRTKKTVQRQPNLDPREELMLEIRNFGGRTALNKVSVSQINWQLKVHGTTTSVTA